jgi:hypothetical protein
MLLRRKLLQLVIESIGTRLSERAAVEEGIHRTTNFLEATSEAYRSCTPWLTRPPTGVQA